jgi:hypothetical protein
MRGNGPAATLVPKGVKQMALSRKDIVATGLTILVVFTFIATHEAWGVPLIGTSHRWAAAAIALLGIATCGQGSPARGKGTMLVATLGVLALGLAVLAIVTGSLTPLSLLVVDIVVLWAISTARHTAHAPHAPTQA